MIRIAIALAISTSFLAACATPDGEFPSLAKRPFETQAPVKEPQEAEIELPDVLPVTLAASVNSMMARHKAAQGKFDAAFPGARSAMNAASGSGVASEAWIVAQVKLSQLDKARSDSVGVQGEMDILVIQQLDAESLSKAELLSPLLAPYQAQIVADVAKQNAEIGKLANSLAQ